VSPEELKAVDHRIVEEALNRGDQAVIDELVAPDFVDHANPPGLPHGPEGFKVALTLFRSAFPDMHVTVEDHVAEGDRVARRMTIQGTHRGDLFGIPPTGKPMATTGIHLVRLAGGKLVEHWGINDDVGMLQQLGVVPGPGLGQPSRAGSPPVDRAVPAATDPTTTKAVARRFIDEVINEGNLAAIDDLVAADYIYHGPGMEVRGPDGIRSVFAMLRTAFPDWHETLEDFIAEADRAVFRVTGYGTHQGEFFGIPPTGKRVAMGGLDLVRVEGGKLAEHWANFDQLGLLRQLGAIPAPGQPGT
jgi:steroid delta-isomerase-like uncharacterized protein